ncbi:unnamed protein product [Hymenolepis diminuta]|uniref:Uncharacterized protein n=1 Tax=Hymenolepis diminuta TaxID=6216 RepID=A0A3P6ZFM0_HYMDI|nr:unnamed protein product [Hymenolepis diminuta]
MRSSLETPDLSRSARSQPRVFNYPPNSYNSATPPPPSPPPPPPPPTPTFAPPPPTHDSLILPPTVDAQPVQPHQAMAQAQYEVRLLNIVTLIHHEAKC